MQNAATVLDVIGKRGARGLPVKRLYRQLFNPQLFLMAYGKLYSNAGAMTPGVTGETVDGMSLAKIETIITALRGERYRWRPVKRIHIPKKNGKQRARFWRKSCHYYPPQRPIWRRVESLLNSIPAGTAQEMICSTWRFNFSALTNL